MTVPGAPDVVDEVVDVGTDEVDVEIDVDDPAGRRVVDELAGDDVEFELPHAASSNTEAITGTAWRTPTTRMAVTRWLRPRRQDGRSRR